MTMLDPNHPLWRLARTDRRYKIDAYLFVFDALRFAQQELGMGHEAPSEPSEEDAQATQESGEDEPEPDEDDENQPHRHVTGQELCQAIREYAVRQFGYMAKPVLNNWGIHKTGDFGEIVYNLIKIGMMRKTHEDRREDFDDVYDFEEVFCRKFRITSPDEEGLPA